MSDEVQDDGGEDGTFIPADHAAVIFGPEGQIGIITPDIADGIDMEADHPAILAAVFGMAFRDPSPLVPGGPSLPELVAKRAHQIVDDAENQRQQNSSLILPGDPGWVQ